MEYNEDSLEWTNNSNYYNKMIKLKRERHYEIRCGLCPYNRHENNKRFPIRSWKTWRKTQYRPQ
jgi:hypothetical protein